MQTDTTYNEAVLSSLQAEIEGLSRALTEELQSLSKNPYIIGSSNAASGALALALLVAAAPATGALAGSLGAITAAAGISQAGLGLAQLILASLGDGSNVTKSKALADVAIDLSNNPFNLVLGTAGFVIDKEVGMKKGLEIGKLVSGTVDLASGLKPLASRKEMDLAATMSGFIGISGIDTKVLSEAGRSKSQRPVSNSVNDQSADKNSSAPSLKVEEAIEWERKRLEEVRRSVEELERQAKERKEKQSRDDRERDERQRREAEQAERRAKIAAEQRAKAEEAARAAAEAAAQAEAAAAAKALEDAERARAAAELARTQEETMKMLSNGANAGSGGGAIDLNPTTTPASSLP